MNKMFEKRFSLNGFNREVGNFSRKHGIMPNTLFVCEEDLKIIHADVGRVKSIRYAAECCTPPWSDISNKHPFNVDMRIYDINVVLWPGCKKPTLAIVGD
jgi:hypothetical protein